jgi:hypothetical protein
VVCLRRLYRWPEGEMVVGEGKGKVLVCDRSVKDIRQRGKETKEKRNI